MTFLSAALLLGVWQVVSMLAGSDSRGVPTVPDLPTIADNARLLSNYWPGGLGVEETKTGGATSWTGAGLGLLYNAGITAWRLAAGLTLGFIVGVGLAVAISWSPILRGLFSLPAHLSRMLPVLAMVTLFDFWFGATELGSILFVAFTTFVTIFVIAVNAIGNVPVYYGRYALSLGANRQRTYLTVVLPAALPELRGGVLLAVGFAWSAAIASEYIGQEYGLGHIVQNAEFFGRTPLLALVGLVAIVLAITTYAIVGKILNWSTRWAE